MKKIFGSILKGFISPKLKALKAAKDNIGLTPVGEVDKYHMYSNSAKWVVIGILILGVASGKLDESFVKKMVNKFWLL